MGAEEVRVITRAGQRIKRGLLRARSQLKGMQARAAHQRSGMPIPPPRLIHLVSGTYDVDWFLESGAMAARSLRATLEKQGLKLELCSAILDFGCGVGRTLRHLSGLRGPSIHGTDYNPDLIEWCQRNLPFAHFQLNGLAERLRYTDSQFDFIYVLSVLTHLSEQNQHFWMNEFSRILMPGGHLLISLHGECYLPQLTSDEARQFQAGQLVVRGAPSEGKNSCASFHPEGYVREVLANGFRVVDFCPEGALGNPRQDVYLLQKTGPPRAAI
jgi:SAM-dependent methyltransferase